MKKYQKRPVVIEATQWDGTATDATRIIDWVLENGGAARYWCSATAPRDCDMTSSHTIAIPTLEGTMIASPGDYIIRGVEGEFYPCKPSVFEATYGEVLSSRAQVAVDEAAFDAWVERATTRPTDYHDLRASDGWYAALEWVRGQS